MGLFDRFLPKSPAPRPPAAASPVPAAGDAPGASEPLPPVPETPAPAPTGVAVLNRLKQAREELERKNAAAALVIYEEVLAAAGDRPDVLMTVSGDLGVTGHTREMIELVAPRYDAERHGPATGFNLLQAYLAVREPQAAQHVLDLLFALNRPELQDRLFGFSNVVADMMLMEAEGTIAPVAPAAVVAVDPNVNKIDLVTISKPVWFYGLERLSGLLPPKEGRLRRVAFAQLALPAVRDVEAAMQQPEDELARMSRGIPLWLAETLLFSPHYGTVAVAATARHDRYVVFNAEWAPEHLRQLVDSTEGGLDYVFIGSLEQKHADYELALRVWEVKKFRERKAFTVRWTPATADHALADLGAQIRAFMEFTPYPAGQGLAYAPPAALRDYTEALGGALSLFLAEKQVLPAVWGVLPAEMVAAADRAAAQADPAALLALGLRARAARLGLAAPPPPAALAAGPVVAEARRELGL